jgi:hypothetical protein
MSRSLDFCGPFCAIADDRGEPRFQLVHHGLLAWQLRPRCFDIRLRRSSNVAIRVLVFLFVLVVFGRSIVFGKW